MSHQSESESSSAAPPTYVSRISLPTYSFGMPSTRAHEDPQDRVRTWNDTLQDQPNPSPSVQDTISDITVSSEMSVPTIGMAPTPQYGKHAQPTYWGVHHDHLLQSTTKSSLKERHFQPDNGPTSMTNSSGALQP